MRRTPLFAGGFLAGALIGALPPMQTLSARWQCTAGGGQYSVAERSCELRRTQPPRLPPGAGSDGPTRLPPAAGPDAPGVKLINEEGR